MARIYTNLPKLLLIRKMGEDLLCCSTRLAAEKGAECMNDRAPRINKKPIRRDKKSHRRCTGGGRGCGSRFGKCAHNPFETRSLECPRKQRAWWRAAIGNSQEPRPGSVLQQTEKDRWIEWLFQDSVGAMGGGVRKALRLPAGHNDGQIGAEFLKFMKNFPSIFRIQIQIQQNNVNLVLGVEENRFVAGRGAEYFVIFGGKNSRQRLPNSNIVLNEQQITLTNHLTPLITSFVPKSRKPPFC